jgi:hypothetical protein
VDEVPELGSDVAQGLVQKHHADQQPAIMYCKTCHLTCTISKDLCNAIAVLACPLYDCVSGQLKVARKTVYMCPKAECGFMCEAFAWPNGEDSWCLVCKDAKFITTWRDNRRSEVRFASCSRQNEIMMIERA